MCLTIPMRVIETDGLTARCTAKGVERIVSLMLLQHENVRPGDFLSIHLGHAAEKISQHDALAAWQLYDEMLASLDATNDPV